MAAIECKCLGFRAFDSASAIAGMTFRVFPGILAQYAAKSLLFRRIRKQFLKFVVEHADPDLGQNVKILENPIKVCRIDL